MREEQDSIGVMSLSDNVYYGVQTERARQNFDISSQTAASFTKFIWAVAVIKKSAAIANREIGALETHIADAICLAADEVISGKMDSEFPINVFQGGGGTSTNMNMNEVLANRANEILTGHKGYDTVHPNTHVNMGQSTNDVIPAAMKIACRFYLEEMIESIDIVEKALIEKREEFKSIVKLGRTCLQDALPVTLGQEFGGYVSFVIRRKNKIQALLEDCLALPLGATAVGTGLSTMPGYIEHVYTHLSKITGRDFCVEDNLFDGLQNADIYIDVSAAIKGLATGLSKIATDFRMLSSGPKAGFNEIILPSVQPGSSIMPGKVNPVIPELINQICYQVCGYDTTITMAVEGGELDLNVWEPVIIKSLFESCGLLTKGMKIFAEKSICGIKANSDVCKKYAESSIALSTIIATLKGYDVGSVVAKKAVKENKTIKEVAIEENIFSKEEAEILLNPINLTDMEKSAKLLKTQLENIHK